MCLHLRSVLRDLFGIGGGPRPWESSLNELRRGSSELLGYWAKRANLLRQELVGRKWHQIAIKLRLQLLPSYNLHTTFMEPSLTLSDPFWLSIEG